MVLFAHNICFISLLAISVFATANALDRSFSQYYEQFWGGDNFKLLQNGDDEVQLVLDQSSGAGFKSKQEYLSGRFHISMKLPKQISNGVVPNFYLISENIPEADHTELDFEFIGTTRELRTNIYANDKGGRERGFQLWFDPSDDFHSYTILWNSHQIVFFVDDIPITAYENRTSSGARFPAGPMHVEATVWNADWAGGPVNWSLAPFTISYRNFTVTGCLASSGAAACDSSEFEWNDPSQWSLSPEQKQKLMTVEQRNMLYGYCTGKTSTDFPECS